jgi:hypothetical protein
LLNANGFSRIFIIKSGNSLVQLFCRLLVTYFEILCAYSVNSVALWWSYFAAIFTEPSAVAPDAMGHFGNKSKA